MRNKFRSRTVPKFRFRRAPATSSGAWQPASAAERGARSEGRSPERRAGGARPLARRVPQDARWVPEDLAAAPVICEGEGAGALLVVLSRLQFVGVPGGEHPARRHVGIGGSLAREFGLAAARAAITPGAGAAAIPGFSPVAGVVAERAAAPVAGSGHRSGRFSTHPLSIGNRHRLINPSDPTWVEAPASPAVGGTRSETRPNEEWVAADARGRVPQD